MKRDHLKWTDRQLEWFEQRGCKWEKPCLEPGDFILWDSRTAHYGAAPVGSAKRMAVCESDQDANRTIRSDTNAQQTLATSQSSF